MVKSYFVALLTVQIASAVKVNWDFVRVYSTDHADQTLTDKGHYFNYYNSDWEAVFGSFGGTSVDVCRDGSLIKSLSVSSWNSKGSPSNDGTTGHGGVGVPGEFAFARGDAIVPQGLNMCASTLPKCTDCGSHGSCNLDFCVCDLGYGGEACQSKLMTEEGYVRVYSSDHRDQELSAKGHYFNFYNEDWHNVFSDPAQIVKVCRDGVLKVSDLSLYVWHNKGSPSNDGTTGHGGLTNYDSYNFARGDAIMPNDAHDRDCAATLPTCVDGDCGSHGVCNLDKCTCSDGYAGDNCEISPGCLGVNCNSGSCNQGVCTCTDNFLGTNCEIAKKVTFTWESPSDKLPEDLSAGLAFELSSDVGSLAGQNALKITQGTNSVNYPQSIFRPTTKVQNVIYFQADMYIVSGAGDPGLGFTFRNPIGSSCTSGTRHFDLFFFQDRVGLINGCGVPENTDAPAPPVDEWFTWRLVVPSGNSAELYINGVKTHDFIVDAWAGEVEAIGLNSDNTAKTFFIDNVIASSLEECSGTPAAPSGGTVEFSNGDAHNSVATFTCDSGLTMTGPKTITCEWPKKWPMAPTCIDYPPIVQNLQDKLKILQAMTKELQDFVKTSCTQP